MFYSMLLFNPLIAIHDSYSYSYSYSAYDLFDPDSLLYPQRSNQLGNYHNFSDGAIVFANISRSRVLNISKGCTYELGNWNFSTN